MKALALWAVWFALVYTSALIYLAPVSVVSSWAEEAVGIAIEPVAGSVWAGAVRVRRSGLPSTDIVWQPRFEAWSSGCAEWSVDVQTTSIKALARAVVGVCPLDGLWYARNVDVHSIVAPWAPLGSAYVDALAGEVAGAIKAIHWRSGELSIDGRIVWRNASVTVGGSVGLGQVSAQLRPQGHQTVVDVVTQDGDVSMMGRAVLSDSGKYQFNATIDPRAQDILRDGLELIGAPTPEGHYLLRSAGRLEF